MYVLINGLTKSISYLSQGIIMIMDGGAPLDDNREHENLCFFFFF